MRKATVLMTAIAGVALALPSPAQAAGPPPPADWMQTVYAAKPDTPLARMIIPGTHDSGAFRIPVSGSCRLRPIAGLNPLIVNAALANPCGAGALAKAQNRSLGQQLADGIRYFDLRIGVPADKVISSHRARRSPTTAQLLKAPLYLHHSFVSQRLTAGLRQILRFSNAHPKEQVILDVQHLDLTGRKAVDHFYTAAVDRILRSYRVAGTTVCSRAWSTSAIPVPDRRLGTDVPLAQVWAAGRNLLVLHARGELPTRSCYRDREKVLHSPWPNTQDPAVSAAANLKNLQSRQQALSGLAACRVPAGNQCGLFVSQLQLSAQFATQAACLASPARPDCSLSEFADKVNNGVVAQIDTWRFGQGLPVNIAIVDFYDDSAPDYATGLIELNQR